MMAISVPQEAIERQVPKHILTLEEVEFSLGSKALVQDLREIGALAGKRRKQRLEFLAVDVAKVAVEYMAGKYDEQLRKLK